MKKIFMTFALLAVTISMMAACANKSQKAQTNETVTAQTTAAEADDDEMAPNFELPDLQGNPRKLSSLRGKYVIIDFWGSWCVWCIRGFPAMKDVYAKYKDDLEILGVDCQDSERKWRTAVEQYEGFPTKAVVSPEGKLLKVVVGEDPEFYTYIDDLLN